MNDLEEVALKPLSGRITRMDHGGISLKMPAYIRGEWLLIGIAGISSFLGIFFGLPGFFATLVLSSLSALSIFLLWRTVSVHLDQHQLVFRWGPAPPIHVALSEIGRIERRPGVGLRIYRLGGRPFELFLPGAPDRELDAVERLLRHAIAQRAPLVGTPRDVAPALRTLGARIRQLFS